MQGKKKISSAMDWQWVKISRRSQFWNLVLNLQLLFYFFFSWVNYTLPWILPGHDWSLFQCFAPFPVQQQQQSSSLYTHIFFSQQKQFTSPEHHSASAMQWNISQASVVLTFDCNRRTSMQLTGRQMGCLFFVLPKSNLATGVKMTYRKAEIAAAHIY